MLNSPAFASVQELLVNDAISVMSATGITNVDVATGAFFENMGFSTLEPSVSSWCTTLKVMRNATCYKMHKHALRNNSSQKRSTLLSVSSEIHQLVPECAAELRRTRS